MLAAVRGKLTELLRIAERDPQVREAEERIHDDLGFEDVGPDKVKEVASDLAGLGGQLRETGRLLRRRRGLVPLALAIVWRRGRRVWRARRERSRWWSTWTWGC